VRKTLKNVLAEYGAVALVLYLVIFALVLGGVYLALKAGWAPASATGKASTFVAAYIITKLTQPLRIGATVILTPLVAKLYERVTGRAGPALPSRDQPPTE
jgi:di/tricarboxylate transporter